MQPKRIYLHFLIIGNILMINNISCVKSDVDYITTCSYNYINNSGKQLQMKVYNSNAELIKDYVIFNGDTLLSFKKSAMGDGINPFNYDNFEYAHGDSIYLTFSNERYQIYRRGDKIFLEKEYKKIIISKREFIYFYEFTPEDYENAIVIE